MIINEWSDYGMNWSSWETINPYENVYWDALRQALINRASVLYEDDYWNFNFGVFIDAHPVLKLGMTDTVAGLLPYAKTLEDMFVAAEDLAPYFIDPLRGVEPVLRPTPQKYCYGRPTDVSNLLHKAEGMELWQPGTMFQRYETYIPGHFTEAYRKEVVYDLCSTKAVQAQTSMMTSHEDVKRRMKLLQEFISFLKYKRWIQKSKEPVTVYPYYSLRPWSMDVHGKCAYYYGYTHYQWSYGISAYECGIAAVKANPSGALEYEDIWIDPHRYVPDNEWRTGLPEMYLQIADYVPVTIDDVYARRDEYDDMNDIMSGFSDWQQDSEYSLEPIMRLPEATKRTQHIHPIICSSEVMLIWSTSCVWIKYDGFLFEGGNDWSDKITEFLKLIPTRPHV